MPRARSPAAQGAPAQSRAVPKDVRVPFPPERPSAGSFLWTCREGFEAFLAQELGPDAVVLGPALVSSRRRKPLEPAFARAVFQVAGVVDGALDSPESAARLAEGLGALRAPALHLQAWVPDADRLNGLTALSRELEQRVAQALGGATSEVAQARPAPSAWLGQLCVLSSQRCAFGAIPVVEALTLAPGGRARMQRASSAPSRAAMKVEEALAWLGLSPGRGETCVDLGAAPGGWTERLLQRGARVTAVDPAKMAPHLARHPKLAHAQQSAFEYAPEEPVDWLFCDMAWRPLEVAQLLAKWARRGWALHLVANLKLPMKDKLPIVERARATLSDGGWKHVRVRQLYHDRDEVTVIARRL
jgi:23S rRNA (cytidine2498-2'-O)-methyltransferase